MNFQNYLTKKWFKIVIHISIWKQDILIKKLSREKNWLKKLECDWYPEIIEIRMGELICDVQFSGATI